MSVTILKTKRTTSSATIFTSAGTLFANNEARVSYKINNLGTNPLYVKEGSGVTTSDFSYVLAAGTSNDNGTGASYDSPNGQCYTGPITVTGTSPRYNGLERSQL